MNEPVQLHEVKTHLELEPDELRHDGLLTGMITAARRAIELRIGQAVVGTAAELGDDDVAVVAQAMLLLIESWFSNRTAVVTGTIATELPLTVSWLLEPLRLVAPRGPGA